MKLDERLFRTNIENFDEFYDFVFNIKQNGSDEQKQNISKVYFPITGSDYGVPASTILHDYKKHNMKKQDWIDLFNNIQSFECYVQSNKQQGFRGENFLFKYYFEDEYFGVGVCLTKDGKLITTFFRDTENGIDAWLQQNKIQGEAPSTMDRYGSLLTHGFNNNIIQKDENVKSYFEICNKLNYINEKATNTQIINNINESMSVKEDDEEEARKHRIRNREKSDAAKLAWKRHHYSYSKANRKKERDNMTKDFYSVAKALQEATIQTDNVFELEAHIDLDNISGGIGLKIEKDGNVSISMLLNQSGSGNYKLVNATPNENYKNLYNSLLDDLKQLANTIDTEIQQIITKNGLSSTK